MKRMIRKHCLVVLIVCVSLLSAHRTVFARSFKYERYNTILKEYVTQEGKVDYNRLREEDYATFLEYIDSLQNASLADMSPDERKVFWINAYNALTIQGVLNNIPDTSFYARLFSVRWSVYGFFDKVKYPVTGEELTLDDIEHVKLRQGFNDPRIHAVIVCASTSCPILQQTAFTAENLDERLDRAMEKFVRDPERNRLDQEKNVLYLSKIFKWFAEDFSNEAGSVIEYVAQYLPQQEAQYVLTHGIKVKYLRYNWFVNKQ